MADKPKDEAEEKKRRRNTLATLGFLGGGAATSALAAWLLMRKGSLKGFNPRQRRIANMIRKGQFGVVVDDPAYEAAMKMSPWARKAQYGTPHVLAHSMPTKSIPKSVKIVYQPDVAYSPLPRSWTRRGIKPLEEPSSAIKPLTKDLKTYEAEFFNRYAPWAIPKSVVLKGTKLKGSQAERARQLREVLNTRIGREWVLKHSGDYQTAGSLLTEKTDFGKLVEAFGKRKGSWKVPGTGHTLQQIRRLERTDPQRYIDVMRKNRKLMQYERLRKILRQPGSGLGQEKLQLIEKKRRVSSQTPYSQRLLNFLSPKSSKTRYTKQPKEYRVHLVGGHVMPATAPRYWTGIGPEMLAPVSPALTKETRDLHQFAKRVLKSLPAKARQASYALDIAPIKGGGFKIVEANPLGYSGFLFPVHPQPKVPWSHGWMMNRVVSGLQGRPTAMTAAPGVALAGLGGLGAAGLATTAL